MSFDEETQQKYDQLAEQHEKAKEQAAKVIEEGKDGLAIAGRIMNQLALDDEVGRKFMQEVCDDIQKQIDAIEKKVRMSDALMELAKCLKST